MKEIQLTQGYVALVDDEDYEYLNKFKWCIQRGSNTVYAKRRSKKDGKMVTEFMHTLILKPNIGMVVDHIDRNGLNNQRVNLRECNISQNCVNRTPHGRSKYIGVILKTDKGYLQIGAHIRVKGRLIWLGYFDTEEDAAKARDIASIKYFREFARLNFPLK